MNPSKPRVIVCGSAAAEGIPAYFCNCRVCRTAAEHGGSDVRGRTSYNFGDVLQIDFGPDALQAFQRHRAALNAMRHVIITHAHVDHLAPAEFNYHGTGYCTTFEHPGTITIHATAPSVRRLRRGLNLPVRASLRRFLEGIGIGLHRMRAFQRFDIPDIDATVLPLAANHAPGLEAVVLLVTLRGRTVLFGNDTGILPDESWRALEAYAAEGRPRLDVAILDNTGGFLPWRDGHMGSEAVLETFARLETLGLTDKRTKRVVNHFSHNAGATHAELCAFYNPRGIDVAYDGMVL